MDRLMERIIQGTASGSADIKLRSSSEFAFASLEERPSGWWRARFWVSPKLVAFPFDSPKNRRAIQRTRPFVKKPSTFWTHAQQMAGVELKSSTCSN